MSEDLRAGWARDLIAQAVYLDHHGGTPYPQALQLRLSYLRAYFESAMHTEHVKNEEVRAKNSAALFGRLDTIVKAIGHLGKVLSRQPRR